MSIKAGDKSINVELETNTLTAEKVNATREWLENQNISNRDLEHELDDLESLPESSVVESSDYDSQSEVSDLDNSSLTTTALGTCVSSEVHTITQSLKELFNSINSGQTVGNVKIENSTGVHIGHVTNIGNVQIIHAGDAHHRISKRKTKIRKKNVAQQQNSEEREERVRPDAFMDRIRFKIPKELCHIIPRHTWLAQSPMEEYEYIQEPVEYVVLSHTATESSEKQAINIRIIRDIQCFHIESREWNDIAYNFLVGCDGNVYTGRGWGVVGAHTMGYNTRAIGISFIGCFMRTLPTEAAFNACKNVLKRGVKEGHLAPDYKLICHCQCRSTESPGRKLFEEIQKWEHFYNIEDDEEQ